jgi:hypothetical protein
MASNAWLSTKRSQLRHSVVIVVLAPLELPLHFLPPKLLDITSSFANQRLIFASISRFGVNERPVNRSQYFIKLVLSRLAWRPFIGENGDQLPSQRSLATKR